MESFFSLLQKNVLNRRAADPAAATAVDRTGLGVRADIRSHDIEAERVATPDDVLHLSNHHRCHSALDGQPPITRVDDLPWARRLAVA